MLRQISTLVASLIAICGASSAAAEMPDLDLSAPISGPMAEAEWDWHPGDLIFRNGLNDLDELVRQAEGGDWATVGILRASSGGPRVVYADETQGVTEVMLYEFTDGLTRDDYAVWRIPALDVNRAAQQTEMGPVAWFALTVAYDAPHDDLMMFGNGRYYSAELPFMAALGAGMVLARPVMLSALAGRHQGLRDRLLADWQSHPYCRVAASAQDCWATIRDMVAVVTPGAIIASDQVEQVFP